MSLPSLQVLTPHPPTFCMLTFPFSSEWLDNDEDGCADIPLVVSKVIFLFVWNPPPRSHWQGHISVKARSGS